MGGHQMAARKGLSLTAADHSPLGRTTVYPDRYDPSQLFPIPRAPKRAEIGLTASTVPFLGADLWTAFELSWLNRRGKPQVAIAHLTVPCETPCIIESKSLKLYLSGLHQTVFDSPEDVSQCLRRDLTEAVWRGQAPAGQVGVRLLLPPDWAREQVAALDGLSLDRLDLDCTEYQPAPAYLRADHSQPQVQEVLVSDLLKSNCLVTGQPDWGSIRVAYTGAPLDQAGLLRYLVSFRQHHEFHEQCVERIFMDIWTHCRPARLSVLARYTRRGGLDINPWRSSHPQMPPSHTRTARQ
jgi:7-cyano-7-deazaguanine reductase